MKSHGHRFRHGLALLALLAAGGGLWFSARYVAAQRKADQAGPSEPAAGAQASAAEALPRLAIDQTEHRFGDLDPADPCEHVFVVRNEGNAPLVLWRGKTSCRCTMSDLPTGPILPGQQAAIRVASKIAQSFGYFSHEAEVLTNDPACQVLRLRITGTVRAALAVDPGRVVFPPVRVDEQASAELTVYSQTWDGFELSSMTASHPALRWEVKPADSETLGRLKARSGYLIRLLAPAELSGQSLWEVLQITAAPRDVPERPRTLKVDLAGTTLRRVGLYGPPMDAQGVVQLGTFASAEGAQAKVMVKVRDNHRALKVLATQAEPDFLKATLKPLNPSAVKYGLYAVEIVVPRGSPPGSYAGDLQGKVRITTDHPYMPEIEFGVAFIVTSL